jgi:hypothetical protein
MEGAQRLNILSLRLTGERLAPGSLLQRLVASEPVQDRLEIHQ